MGLDTLPSSASIPQPPILLHSSPPHDPSSVPEKVVEEYPLDPPSRPFPSFGPSLHSTPSFVEESYSLPDLKDSERRSLLDLKAKIQDAIESNSFLVLPVTDPEPERKDKSASSSDTEKDDKKNEGLSADEQASLEQGVPVQTVSLPPLSDEATSEDASKAHEEARAASTEVASEPTFKDIPLQGEGDADPNGDGGNSSSLEDLELWGVPLMMSKGDERTDVVLLKFLRARDFKVEEAMDMLQETLQWRRTELEKSEEVDEEEAREFEGVAFMKGVDREGHPVCYNCFGVFQVKDLYQRTFSDETRFKKFLRWRIQVQEQGIKTLDFSPNGVHSMLQVIDLRDSPGFVKSRNVIRRAVDRFQNNYPELVAKQIFINVPWYFGALISLHGKLIAPRTRSKYVLARPGKATETLFKYISPENVPLQYGGFNRPNDPEHFDAAESPLQEIALKPGEKQTIVFPVEEPGSIIVWDVSVIGWEVMYGEEFVPSAEGSYTIIIQKSKRMSASEEPVRNSFKVTEAGKVELTIDNISRKKKVVVYRHMIRKAATAS